MVLILDGNQEISMHERSNLSYLTCLRHLNRSRAVTNRIITYEKAYLPSCVRNMFGVTICYKSHGSVSVCCIVIAGGQLSTMQQVHSVSYIYHLKHQLGMEPEVCFYTT